MKKEIGKRITMIRNNLGMKKFEFAKYLGITAQYLGSVESGENCLSVEKLILLSKKANISLDYILLGKTDFIDKKMIKQLADISDDQIEFSLNTIKQLINLLKCEK